MLDKYGLTPKQRAFCDYYLESGNLSDAARKAGYSKKTAHVIGTENLRKPVIAAYIKHYADAKDDNRIAKADEVLEFLTKAMRGEIKDQFDLDPTLQDRLRAGEMLGKRYGMFSDRLKLGGDPDNPAPIKEEIVQVYLPDNKRDKKK